MVLGMAVAPAAPVAAGSDTASGDGWSITVTVPDLVWNNGLACQKVPVVIHVEGAVTGWAVYLARMKVTKKRPNMELLAEGTTAGDFPYQFPGRCARRIRDGSLHGAGAAAVEINGAVSSAQISPPRSPPDPRRPGSRLRPSAAKSKLKVDVDPSAGKKAWTFQVQAKQADDSWVTLPKVYKTRASSEKRTVNLPQGTYRAVVAPKFGFADAFSPEVYLKK